uniref:Ig-like domain-containing protein n=1 Tax=Pelusios castaneus TaxID=367368 RepID=A0A8C8SBC4_9SAUR
MEISTASTRQESPRWSKGKGTGTHEQSGMVALANEHEAEGGRWERSQRALTGEAVSDWGDFVLNKLRIHWHIFRDEDGSVVILLLSPAVNWGSMKLKALGILASQLSVPSKVNQRSCFSAPYEIPQITVLSWEEGEVTLQCKSRGGYPKAEITWQDENGNQLNQSQPAELWRSCEGVFEVQSCLVVKRPGDKSFCCSLIYALLHQNLSVCERVTGNRHKPPPELWCKSSQRPSLTTQDRQSLVDMQPPLWWKGPFPLPCRLGTPHYSFLSCQAPSPVTV